MTELTRTYSLGFLLLAGVLFSFSPLMVKLFISSKKEKIIASFRPHIIALSNLNSIFLVLFLDAIAYGEFLYLWSFFFNKK